MLRYEVMISMCRAVGENIDNITFPYKRYQIQRCWRAENTQKGRYREFTQCDADTIGSSSMICDAEFIQMGLDIVGGLGFEEYVARISNRKFLEGFADSVGLDKKLFYGFCMSLDKIKKIGRDKVKEEMVEMRGIPKDIAAKALDLLVEDEDRQCAFGDLLSAQRKNVKGSKIGNEGLDELGQIAEYLETCRIGEEKYVFDTSLARGLASYTGPVWEFEIIDGGVGSIAGCGRYDKAIEKYVGREIPATGGSFGIERVCDILKDRRMIDLGTTPVVALVTVFDDSLKMNSLRIVNQLRGAGIAAMLYPEVDRIDKQLKYADRKGIPYVIICGPDEVEKKIVQVKDMKKRTQDSISVDDFVALVAVK